MVYDYPQDKQKSVKNKAAKSKFGAGESPVLFPADPMTRLAATMVDFILLAPFLFFVVSPMRREYGFGLLVSSSNHMLSSLGFAIVLAVLLVILYQSITTTWLGGTLGKTFFGLKVVHIWNNQKPNFSASLLRSLSWVVEMLLFGLPFLAILTNEKRRPAHDRLVDTIVVSRGENKVPLLPGQLEKWLGQGFTLGFVFLLLGYGSGFVANEFKLAKHDSVAETPSEFQDNACPVVSEALEKWHRVDNNEVTSRLSVALSLHGAGELSSDCLRVEAEHQLENEKQTEMAYLAMAFAESDDTLKSDRYLNQVCEEAPESSSCQLSEIVSFWAEDKMDEVGTGFAELVEHSDEFVRIWAIRHFVRAHEFDKALTVLAKFEPQPFLSTFLGKHRAKALWGMHRFDESVAVGDTVMESMVSSDRFEFAQWLCENQIENSCSGQSGKSCLHFSQSIDRMQLLLGEAKTALTWLKYNECKDGKNISYETLQEKFILPEVKDLVSALASFANGKKSDGRQLLTKLSLDAQEKLVASEAEVRLIHLSESKKELEPYFYRWDQKAVHSPQDLKLGKVLFQKYLDLENKDRAYEVGNILLTMDPWSKSTQEEVIVLAFDLKKYKEAKSLVKRFFPETQQASYREPASTKTNRSKFTKVKEALQKMADDDL